MYVLGDVHTAQASVTLPLLVSWHSNVTGSSSAVKVKFAVAPGVPTGVTVTTGGVVSEASTVQLWVTGSDVLSGLVRRPGGEDVRRPAARAE